MPHDEEPTKEDITKGLVKYISTFEEFLTWQSENQDAIIQNNGELL